MTIDEYIQKVEQLRHISHLLSAAVNLGLTQAQMDIVIGKVNTRVATIKSEITDIIL